VDDEGSNGGGILKVEHGSNASEVTNVHEAGVEEVGDVVKEKDKRGSNITPGLRTEALDVKAGTK